MKIVINNSEKIIENFLDLGKKIDVEIIGVKTEKLLFDQITEDSSVSGFILSNHLNYTQKAVDFIKKKMPYIPIIIYISKDKEIKGADIQMLNYGNDSINFLFDLSIQNIKSFSSTFDKLQKLTAKITNVIHFGPCKYDPIRRILYYNGQTIKKMTAKEGGILELLGSNFGKIVKKEIILEKVWQRSDYFSGRSMDVYVTNLRKLFKKNYITLVIENITGSGLIMEENIK